jgi:hypothetical protein
VDTERIVTIQRLVITLPAPGRYALRAQVQTAEGQWAPLAELPMTEVPQAELQLATEPVSGRKVRLSVRSASGEPAGVAELRVAGRLQDP